MTKTTDNIWIELSIRIRIPTRLNNRWRRWGLAWGAMLARAQTTMIHAARRAQSPLGRRPFADLTEARRFREEHTVRSLDRYKKLY